MARIQAHTVQRIVTLITALCWIISSNVCFLAEVGNACEIVRPSEYDYESQHVHDHESEDAQGHESGDARDHGFRHCRDHSKNNQADKTELCCKRFGSVVLPRQDSTTVENPLANAVYYLLACLVPPVLNGLKPRKEFQNTGPPQVVSSVSTSLQCCLLGNAPPA